ncbi:MAG: S28 family serine protease [Synergistales bacterium]|nr:S28 family serine protease [Synergistales bacterium]MDY6401257.1 S28 family serine protease [Synergistales bacterium]MDY6404403.1 S28 family serine protease [Synergistales bacterium]MDY6410238.1 S28 family serine protease [Synergistales bacterium]MDY6414391.1 S28 family serine protease [Synergistales bacterium]
MKKIFLLLFLLLSFCGTSAASFKDDLLTLDGVVSVDEIVQSGDSKPFAEKYIVTFVQYLDWNNPDLGTFTQRVEIGFKGYDNVNVIYTGGYELYENDFEFDDEHEISKMYDGNFINVEYRFFSKSKPEGLSSESTALWQYLTDENASKDFHNIIEQLKEILSGRWVFTGASKGGQATNVFAYYFPNDADAYVSYVAPFCDGIDDDRAFNAIYNTIGNERYGEEKAKEYRDLMLDFQVEAIKNRDYLQPLIISNDLYLDNKYPLKTASLDFEVDIADLVFEEWQYKQNFASFDEVMKITPRSDDLSTPDVKENQKFLDALLTLILIRVNDNPLSENKELSFPYVVHAVTENGNYGMRLQPLRDELAKIGLSMDFTAETEKNYIALSDFTQEQLDTFKFNPATRNKMLEWTQTNTSNVIMIYGDSDPWYFMRLPETDNQNIHVFISSTNSHGVTINKMEEELSTEIKALLSEWLMQDADEESKNILSSSGGGCNSGISLFALGLVILLKKKFHS